MGAGRAFTDQQEESSGRGSHSEQAVGGFCRAFTGHCKDLGRGGLLQHSEWQRAMIRLPF